MKKVIVGLVAVGAIFALRSAAGRGGQKMREHCKQMMAGESGEHRAMREHCKDAMAAHKGQAESSETLERPEPDAPQFAGHREAVVV